MANEKAIVNAQKKHAMAMKKISEKDKELRDKMNAQHLKKIAKKELEGIVIKYNSMKNECDGFVKTMNPLIAPMIDILIKLKKESSHQSKWRSVGLDESIVRVVLFSPTGHGKSTLANRICGDISEDANEILKTSDLAEPCTATISHRVVKWGHRRICVVDTPGWDESPDADRKHANNLVSYLRGAMFVHGIAIVKNQSTRFSASDVQMLQRLEAIIGDDLWQHIVLVMTHVEGKGGRPAKEDRYLAWCDSLLKKLDRQYRIGEKLRKTAQVQPVGVTAGNRRCIEDIPIIGLSSFDESGGPFDYSNGITQLVMELQKMGKWVFNGIVSPFDQLLNEFEGMCMSLSKKEKEINMMLNEIKMIEKEICGHPESISACLSNFKLNYKFISKEYINKLNDFKNPIINDIDEKKDD